MSKTKEDIQMPALEQVSAGGVVFRTVDKRTEVVIVLMLPDLRWQLPKGIIDDGETPEQAGLREVREEAGVDAELVAPIETIEYWFVAAWNGERRRIHKNVHFFLMKYRSGSVSDHDHEVDEARWVEIGQAIEMLEFKSEKEIVEKAVKMIEKSYA